MQFDYETPPQCSGMALPKAPTGYRWHFCNGRVALQSNRDRGSHLVMYDGVVMGASSELVTLCVSALVIRTMLNLPHNAHPFVGESLDGDTDRPMLRLVSDNG